MGKSIQDLIDSGEIKDLKATRLVVTRRLLTSLKGVEKLIDLKELFCAYNKLNSLKGIEGLENLEKLYCNNNNLTSLIEIKELINIKELWCNDNELSSLEGIEKFNKLKDFYFNNNPCSSKYKELKTQQIVSKVMIESHLTPDDDLRGAASITDTGLFDFKTK